MTYYLIMFQVDPVPLGAPGPIKLKVKKRSYEIACMDERARIDCSKGSFYINEKLSFSIEEDNAAFCVAKVEKIKQ